MKVRILLADDHPLFLDALRTVLSLESDMEVVGQVQDGAEVSSVVAMLKPDIVCMDINMPGLSGVIATRGLLAEMPEMRVIGLSGHDNEQIIADMTAAGAKGYVAKNRAGDDLVPMIHQLMRPPTQKVCSEKK